MELDGVAVFGVFDVVDVFQEAGVADDHRLAVAQGVIDGFVYAKDAGGGGILDFGPFSALKGKLWILGRFGQGRGGGGAAGVAGDFFQGGPKAIAYRSRGGRSRRRTGCRAGRGARAGTTRARSTCGSGRAR